MMNKLKWATCAVMSLLVIAGTSFAQDEDSRADRLEKELNKYKKQVDRLEYEKKSQLDRLNKTRASISREASDARTLSTTIQRQNSQGRLAAPAIPGQFAQRSQTQPVRTFGQSANGLAAGFNVASTPFFGRRDPKLAEAYNLANKQLAELVKKIKEAESEEVKLELKEEVKSLLEAKYDAYLDHHEAPLIELEERLVKLREEFEQRKKAKEDLVKLRLDTVWYDAIGLGWPDNQRGNSVFGLSNSTRWNVPANVETLPRLSDRPANLIPPTAPRPVTTESTRNRP